MNEEQFHKELEGALNRTVHWLATRFKSHDSCEDGWYACPRAEGYCGHFEDHPIEARPCYCLKDQADALREFIKRVLDNRPL